MEIISSIAKVKDRAYNRMQTTGLHSRVFRNAVHRLANNPADSLDII